MIRLQTPSREERGASFAELALMLPLALFLIYGLLYFSLSMIVESVAESAVHSALDDAITRIDLEEIPDPIPNCNLSQTEGSPEEKFCDAINGNAGKNIVGIVDQVKSLPSQTFFAQNDSDYSFAYFKASPDTGNVVDVKIPSRTSGSSTLSSEQAYDQQPIIIELSYAVQPIFPGLPERIYTARAVGYREVQSSLSYPIPTDCQGNPYGDEEYDDSLCQCNPDAGQGYNEATGKCKGCTKGRVPYIPGDPKYGVKPTGSYYSTPYEGCWCPTSTKCQQIYGPGAAYINAGSSKCQCFCNWHWGFGYNEGSDLTKGCKCNNAPGSGKIAGVFKDIPIKTGQKTLIDGRCYCMVDDGTEEGRKLKTSDCEEAFVGDDSTPKLGSLSGPGSEPGTVIADADKCECRCKTGGCDEDIYGTPWHQGSPAAGCSCQCSSFGGSGTNPCFESGWGGINLCQSISEVSGKCECDAEKVAEERGDAAADCPAEDCSTNPDNCAKKKFAGRNCDCVCDKDALNCGEFAHVDEATCTCKCNTDKTFSGGPESCDPDGGEGGGFG